VRWDRTARRGPGTGRARRTTRGRRRWRPAPRPRAGPTSGRRRREQVAGFDHVCEGERRREQRPHDEAELDGVREPGRLSVGEVPRGGEFGANRGGAEPQRHRKQFRDGEDEEDGVLAMAVDFCGARLDCHGRNVDGGEYQCCAVLCSPRAWGWSPSARCGVSCVLFVVKQPLVDVADRLPGQGDCAYPLGRDFVTRLDTISAASGRDTGVLGEHELIESRLSGYGSYAVPAGSS
jgi:hypothetical protein